VPIYEYVCTSCGKRIDVVHGIHASGPAVCEVCGGAMRKALSAPAIHFKGSGWAKVDARSSAKPSGASATAASGDASTPTSESTSSGDAKESTGGDASKETKATRETTKPSTGAGTSDAPAA
jgi:putative FmdB family regulatory protein